MFCTYELLCLYVACCVLRVACCVLRVACCVLRVACCVLRVACCVLHAHKNELDKYKITLLAEENELKYAVPGGLIGVGTKIDPTLCRADRLVGQVWGDQNRGAGEARERRG